MRTSRQTAMDVEEGAEAVVPTDWRARRGMRFGS